MGEDFLVNILDILYFALRTIRMLALSIQYERIEFREYFLTYNPGQTDFKMYFLNFGMDWFCVKSCAEKKSPYSL